MELERGLPLIEDARLARIVARVLEHEPEATAVIARGSYAKATAGAASDLDLTALGPSPRVRYRMWFDDGLHVSLEAKTVDDWLAQRVKPASWSLGLPAREDAVYLIADGGTRLRLGDPPSNERPPGPPELQDFVEFVVKARRAARAGDGAGVRLWARGAAELGPALLAPLNDLLPVRDPREAVEAAAAMRVAPPDWRHGFLVAYGLVGGDVAASVTRLARNLLAFLREHAPDVDPQPEIGHYLRDGTLERLFDD